MAGGRRREFSHQPPFAFHPECRISGMTVDRGGEGKRMFDIEIIEGDNALLNHPAR
ncbi:hypothetical protein [Streptomyces sp. NPDC045251]|uniref:hypothetical protein n=1 Tax=unclassified Streptomyces TaxID=2593676 RepID=UPI0033F46C95